MMTELDRELLFWKNLLGLNSWEIKAEFVHYAEIDGFAANTARHNKGERANIKIMRPEDRVLPPVEDWRLDLIHELVHIRLWAIERALNSHQDDLLGCAHEVAVEWLARALYYQKYGRHWEEIGDTLDTPGERTK